MSSRILPFGFRPLAALAALSVLALPLLAADGHATVSCASQTSSSAVSAPGVGSKVANPWRPQLLELAGNRKRDNDDNFDPYGKDDPTNRRWGESAGMGNRFGGLYTRGEKNKGERTERNPDRGEREQHKPRGE